MLHLLDESLEAFFRAVVPLAPREVDLSFAAPDRDWAAGVSKPTVDLFLWDVRPNTDEAAYGLLAERTADGRTVRRGALPRIDCRYLVTAWTRDVRDEHALLGRVLAAVLRHDTVSEEHLVGPLATVRPVPSLELRAGSGTDNSDFWAALGGQLKPGLDLVITITVDAEDPALAGPPVDQVLLGFGDPEDPESHPAPDTLRLLHDGRTPAQP